MKPESTFWQHRLPHFGTGRFCYDFLPQAGHAHPGPSVHFFRGGGISQTRPLPQRAAALTLTAALLTGAAFPAFADTYYIENGDIVISAGTEAGTNKVEQGGTLKSENDKGTIISSSNKDTVSDNTVTINAENEKDKVEVALKDLNIDAGSTDKAAVSVTGNGATTIELDGDNKLKSGSAHAGLEHNKTDTSGELIIQDNNKDGGSLKATGGQFGAGIGGAGVNDAQVKITGGKITATGGEYGAGIGGGFKGSGDVTITGGEIHANGGSYSAGIGGGDYSSGKVTISGGEINATGGYLGAGIGGGEKGSGDVTITGGEITANGGSYGAGIGGGKEGRGDVTIEGNTEVNAAGGTGGAGIGGGYGAKNNSNSTGNQITIRSNENGSPTVNAVGGGTKKGIADIGGAGIGTGSKSDANTAITLEGKVTIKATAGKGNVAIGTNGNEQVFTGLAGGTSITRKDSDKNDIPPLPGDNVPTPSGGDTAGGGSAGGGSAGGDSAGGGSTGGDSTGGDSTGGDSADVSVQESVFPGLVVTGKDGQRTSYTSIRGNNILSLRVGRFTASFRISLSTLRQLRAEGIDTITFQTILCSTTLSVDELLALGGEDTPVALAHSMGTARLTVGGADYSELLK